MNKKLVEIINENLYKIRQSNRTGLNHIRKGGAGLLHELKKAEIATKLMYESHVVMTDVIWADGSGVADIFILSIRGGMVYEILHSETMDDFNKKSYPVRKMIPVKV